jgi:ApbE superfamily uncharacterized protein (UPF0280 family)
MAAHGIGIMVEYCQRTYRDFKNQQRLIPFRVAVKETDLFIKALTRLDQQTRSLIVELRSEIENYIRSNPLFQESLTPLPFDPSASPIVRAMLDASSQANVGPMAAVAGAIAEWVGTSLLPQSPEVIVENGGDVFISTSESTVIEIFAGSSPFSQRIGIRLEPSTMPMGICTSSATVGPSLSFGKADAVTVVSSSTPLADAVATSIGNEIQNEDDIPAGLKMAESIPGLLGVVVLLGERMGIWGNVELVKLH